MTGIVPMIAALQPILPLLGTLAAYEAGLRAQRRLGGAASAKPVLIAVVLVSSALISLGTSPTDYLAGVQPLILLLGPATIALAIRLYRSLPRMRVALVPVLIDSGRAVTAIGTAVVLAELLGAPNFVVTAMATTSVTTAVAIAVASHIGSDPSVAAGIAVLTGIVGAVMCTAVLDWSGVHDERARGLVRDRLPKTPAGRSWHPAKPG